MPIGLLAATTGAQVLPSRLRSARNASPSNSGVASKDGLTNSRMEADAELQPSLCPAERLKMMDLRLRPWPEAAEAEPAFVRRGNPKDIAQKEPLGNSQLEDGCSQ